MATLGNLAVALRRMADSGVPPVAQIGMFNVTTAAVGTTVDLKEICSDFEFIVATLSGGETLKVQGTVDGTVYEDLPPFDVSTLCFPANTAALANGSYKLPLNLIAQYRYAKFVKSAGANAVNVCYAYAKMGRQK